MADITQLEESGVVKYMKTHTDAIDGVEGRLIEAIGNETVLGTEDFQDGIQIGGKSIPVNARPTYEVVKDYWDGTGAYLTEFQSVTISNSSNVDKIVLTFSRYNNNGGGIAHSIPATLNITKLRYELPAVVWVGSASANPIIMYKKIFTSKSGTSLVITGDTADTLNEVNKKIAFREIGVMHYK